MKVLHGITGNIDTDGVLSDIELAELNQAQFDDAKAIQAYWQENGHGAPYPLLIKPTGYGKGRVIDMLLHPNNEPGMAMLIVGTKNVLVEQNQEALQSLVHEETGENRFSILPDTSGPVVVATWQSVEAYRKTAHLPLQIDLLIIDEGHNAGTGRRQSLIRWLNPKKVLGATATGYRASGAFRAPESYNFRPLDDRTITLPECIERKWLSPLMGLCIDTEVILPRDVMTCNKISGKKLYRELRHHPDLFSSIAIEIGTRFLPSGMKTIVVVNRVLEEACVIYKQLETMGFTVGLAVNQQATMMLRDDYVTVGSIERYKLPSDHPDAIQVLISPQVIGEGFDYPPTECIVWASPTDSSLRYTQIMGRGARRCLGKAYCLIVDFVYLIEGYGYSMNFAQFFKRTEMKEVEGGFMYVGPSIGAIPANVSRKYTEGARVVSIVDLQHQVTIFPSGDWLDVTTIASAVGRSEGWVNRRLDKVSVTPELRRRKSGQGQAIPHYPPSVIDELKKLDSAPEAGDWLCLPQIAASLQRTTIWVGQRLETLGFVHEMRIEKKGHTIPHYPPSVIDELKKLDSAPEAGDWTSLEKVATTLGRTRKWVERQKAKLSSKSELRRNHTGKTSPHYSPGAVEELRKLDSIPKAGDWLTVAQIRQLVPRSHTWISARLTSLCTSPEVRKTTDQQAQLHYPPSVVDELKKLIDEDGKKR